MQHIAAIAVFLAAFIGVSVLGFLAARRKSLASLDEWGLGGRSFGTLLSWFLIGGDLYTAYTFIAIPALIYGAGAIGFFGIPYTIIIYPLIFAVMPRLWTVCRNGGYVTAADFVHGRFDRRYLSFAVAATGIVATMPYIALQLVGIQVVIAALGFPVTGPAANIPLLLAFLTVAAYTYTSGIRAPAIIAVAKDILIYVTIAAAIIIIPGKLGGWSGIFSAVPPEKTLLMQPSATNFGTVSAYITQALGSAIALIFYPHSLTAMLSAKSRSTLRHNAILLPAYSLLLGFLSLLGFIAIAAHVESQAAFAPFFAHYHASFAVPALFLQFFPDWFVGVAFAAIAIGALVPAAIMAIAAANLFTRNILQFDSSTRADGQATNVGNANESAGSIDRETTDRTDARVLANATAETTTAKRASIAVMIGALAFMVCIPQKQAIGLQLLGGIWIIQTAPSIVFGLFSRFFEARGLFAGWAIGMAYGTAAFVVNGFQAVAPLTIGQYTVPAYIALTALILNCAVAAVFGLFARLTQATSLARVQGEG